ncbi:Icc-related predicted phosphoesterase [Crossiella equi]|uniref:Icc-related predicted phosphoesterase n=1 Tax=Crossiella equi TaxID=130796 RepID=A0ABS5AJE6_9PSEU|nr:metallophosphoesterase [Crossiella equi]MBP2476502.1 Icc-related predicted phosphoesterase [Crossiella equi]
MPRVLVVSDEVVAHLWTEQVRQHEVDLILGAGDLPFDYLEYLVSTLDRPCVFVPGNHDADLSGYSNVRGLWTRDGMPARWPGPAGAANADGTVVDVAGLRIAGLGGSIRYNRGPNQWTERQQARRARRLVRTANWRRLRDGKGVDVLLTHSPPKDCGDREDPPHRGFACLHDTVHRLRPRLLLHGHIHPHGEKTPDRQLGDTLVRNVVGYHLLDIRSPEEVGRAR